MYSFNLKISWGFFLSKKKKNVCKIFSMQRFEVGKSCEMSLMKLEHTAQIFLHFYLMNYLK